MPPTKSAVSHMCGTAFFLPWFFLITESTDGGEDGVVAEKPRSTPVSYDKLVRTVDDALFAFSLVENPSFREIINALAPNLKVPGQRTLLRLISVAYSKLKTSMKAYLTTLAYVATTTDCWATEHRYVQCMYVRMYVVVNAPWRFSDYCPSMHLFIIALPVHLKHHFAYACPCLLTVTTTCLYWLSVISSV